MQRSNHFLTDTTHYKKNARFRGVIVIVATEWSGGNCSSTTVCTKFVFIHKGHWPTLENLGV